ncbi:DUF4253 domain-containing protein [Aestuariibius sp. HNIBRBA575]|uniref:DUF4253 domain-containing protein n=1 Tax=Aestuariibius sp. HNIBRBA575 TaxID=3233343 RepID=UPI0034A147B8
MQSSAVFLALTCASPIWAEQSHFPYPTLIVSGAEAEQEWRRLRDAPGTPVILGSIDDFSNVADAFSPDYAEFHPHTPAEYIALSADLNHPSDLYASRQAEWDRYLEWLRENGDAADIAELEAYDPLALDDELIGRIPLFYPATITPIGYEDWQTNRPYDQVVIAILPTENSWEAPAYLRFGGWNENPSPEYHVAALRDWHDRYGAEPIVISTDVMELWAPRQPNTNEDGINLAIEHFHYDNDIVYQGVGSIGALAADRMRSTYWFFWWD